MSVTKHGRRKTDGQFFFFSYWTIFFHPVPILYPHHLPQDEDIRGPDWQGVKSWPDRPDAPVLPAALPRLLLQLPTPCTSSQQFPCWTVSVWGSPCTKKTWGRTGRLWLKYMQTHEHVLWYYEILLVSIQKWIKSIENNENVVVLKNNFNILHIGGTSQDVKRLKKNSGIFTLYTLGFLEHLLRWKLPCVLCI